MKFSLIVFLFVLVLFSATLLFRLITAPVPEQESSRDKHKPTTQEPISMEKLAMISAKIFPGARIPMPAQIFTPDYRRKWMEKKNQYVPGVINNSEEYLKTPETIWRERIPMRTGFGFVLYAGLTDQFNKFCPVCKLPARFGKVDIYDGTVIMDCCKTVMYEDPSRYPTNAPYRPNRTMKIKHWDGAIVEYPYYEFADHFSADRTWTPWWTPAEGSKKPEIFIPDGYIRYFRLQAIVNTVIPQLGWAYFFTGEEKYARLAVVLLDRLAELYPTWPLWRPYQQHGYALNQAGNGLLTREEYEAAKRPIGWGHQFWSFMEGAITFAHLKMGELFYEEGMQRTANLALAYAAIRDSKAIKSFSTEKYGGPDKADQHIMQNLFGEMAKLYKCYRAWFGNQTTGGLVGSIYLGILIQDRYFFDIANELMERQLYDEFYFDHIPTQGSPSYWGQVLGGLITSFQLREEMYDPDVKKRHPRLAYLPTAAAPMLPLLSWRYMLPSLGDTWNDLYPTPWGGKTGTRQPDDFSSTHYSDFGISMLRFGKAEGRRQELFLAYQRVAGHGHSDALNIEYFVDGLSPFWDMGYGNGTLDTDTNRHPEMVEVVKAPWPRPVFNTGPYYKDGKGEIPIGHWWSGEWTHRTPAHCTVMVDEQEPVVAWGRTGAGIPVTIFSEPITNQAKRLLEVIDIEERGAFKPVCAYVKQFRRTILTVETPGGGGYLVDIFRVAGGKMHEFYYHAISEKASGNLPEGTHLPGTLAHYRECTRKQTDKMKELDNPDMLQTPGWSQGYRHINALRLIAKEPETWKLAWEYDPMLYAPFTEVGKKNKANLLEQQKPISVIIHGIVQKGTATNAALWRARGLLTGHLREQLKDGRVLDGGWQSTVGFVGGLDMVVLERRGPEDLKSVFTHVIEGHRAGLTDEVLSASNLPQDKTTDGAVALRIALQGGCVDYVFCLPEPGEIAGKDYRFSGRYGLLRLDAKGHVVCSAIVRGSEIACGDFKLNATPEFTFKVERLEGDISGDRTAPAIIGKPGQPIPEGTALAGNPVMLTARDGWSDTFIIESVKSLGKGRCKINLRGHPNFILDFLTVGNADQTNALAFFAQEMDLSKASLNAIYENNITLVSMKNGKSFPVDVYTENCQYSRITFRDRAMTLANSGLTNGDKAILVRYLPGDLVTIPLRKTEWP